MNYMTQSLIKNQNCYIIKPHNQLIQRLPPDSKTRENNQACEAAFELLKSFLRSATLFIQAAFDLPGTAAVIFSHLIATSFGNAFNAFNKAISSAELQLPPLLTLLLTLLPSPLSLSITSSTRLSTAFRSFKNFENESESFTFLSPIDLAIFTTLSTLCLPLNTSATASHRPGIPTGFFTICFFNNSRSSKGFGVGGWGPGRRGCRRR
ncbi:hypothetical protein HanRHA438_Chr06g0251771 [Helianthus annuus]|nr:hypothetical protein HanRHA438_Chr06g0251771 [Helianthus annuus]